MKIISPLVYLKNEGILDEEMFDCLRYELDKHIHYYGDHFKRPLDKVKRKRNEERLKNKLRKLYAKRNFFKNDQIISSPKPLIISNAYFTVNDELQGLGYRTIQPPWVKDDLGFYDKDLIKLIFKIRELLDFADFNFLVSNEFIALIRKFKAKFKAFLLANEVKGFIVPNDESFFENISIKICKELSIPSFIFLHGLPGRYNGIDEDRSDFLIVWGKKIKELYIESGINREKIFVSGHPYYKKYNMDGLRFSLNNIVILTKAMSGTPHSDGVLAVDRGKIILYLLLIQKTLKKMNVKKVKLRPHPSENIQWYLSFLDKNFFEPDTSSLNDSLNKATLVIGPTSSVFLEALYNGVNYVVFEPLMDGKSLSNYQLVPPFDLSDKRIPVANNEADLLNILKDKISVNPQFLNEYLHTPFDINFIKKLIKN